MKKLMYFITTINLSLLINSCIDSVPFPTKSDEGFLAIDGTFHNLADTQFIRLYRSAGYEATPNFVTGAIVTVYGNNNTSATYNEIRPGIYALLPKILRGVVGTSYYVEIKTRNGSIYRSAPEVMPAPVKPDSISFSAYDKEELSESGIKIIGRTLRLLINTPLKNGNIDASLRWYIEDCFEFITIPECGPFKSVLTCYYSRPTLPTNRMVLASSKDLLISRADALPINEFSLQKFPLQFKNKHVWNVTQFSITEKAYNYWKGVDKISNQVGSLFDLAPAYVQGNIYNTSDATEKVLGYFEVAAVEKIARPLTIGLINRDYGYVLPLDSDPCDNIYDERQRPLCCYCPSFTIPGWSNSPQEPYYWQ
jgi:Domain of unknown function (DUF4249)